MNRIRKFTDTEKTIFSCALLLVAVVAMYARVLDAHVLFAAAALPVTLPTLYDVIRQKAPGGGLLPIVESLTRQRPFLQDAVWLPCNNGTFHRVNSRTALPAPSYVGINEGVPPTKSTTDQVDETTCMLSDLCKTDARLIDLNGPEYRLREVVAHLAGFQNEIESGSFYNSVKATPKKMHGIMPRLDATAGTPAGAQIIKADAAAAGSDQASIVLVGWGSTGVHMIYPEGTTGGIKHTDMGDQLTKDAGGTNEFRAFVDVFDWHWGLAVEDYRYVCRIANVDTSNLTAAATLVIEAMIKGWYQTMAGRGDKSVRWAWYCDPLVAAFLHLQARAGVTNSTLRIDTIDGQPVTMFLGAPVRVTDGLLNTEAIVA
jgi:hypothetical protein